MRLRPSLGTVFVLLRLVGCGRLLVAVPATARLRARRRPALPVCSAPGPGTRGGRGPRGGSGLSRSAGHRGPGRRATRCGYPRTIGGRNHSRMAWRGWWPRTSPAMIPTDAIVVYPVADSVGHPVPGHHGDHAIRWTAGGAPRSQCALATARRSREGTRAEGRQPERARQRCNVRCARFRSEPPARAAQSGIAAEIKCEQMAGVKAPLQASPSRVVPHAPSAYSARSSRSWPRSHAAKPCG